MYISQFPKIGPGFVVQGHRAAMCHMTSMPPPPPPPSLVPPQKNECMTPLALMFVKFGCLTDAAPDSVLNESLAALHSGTAAERAGCVLTLQLRCAVMSAAFTLIDVWNHTQDTAGIIHAIIIVIKDN